MEKFHKNANITLLSTLLAVALLSMTGVAFASGTNLAAKGSQWAIYEENTLPNGDLHFYPAAHGTLFPMPDATASSPTFVNYMLDTYNVALSESNTITATFTVAASSGAVIMGDPLWTTQYGSPVNPAFVRLFIQSNLPSDGTASCVPGNDNEGNYWWADAASYTFATGTGNSVTVTLTAPLSASGWSGICGNAASFNQAGFDNSLAHVHLVGLSFGSGSFFASGVGVNGQTGTATFQLTSYTIN